MQIKRGTTRVVLIAFGFAFKFPALRQRTVHGRVFHYLRGMTANLTEFAAYISCGRPGFLVPVVSFGFVSIQRFQAGERPTWDEMDTILSQLSERPRRAIAVMDLHPFAPSNFRRTSSGLKMIDYGDLLGDTYPLTAFLNRYHEELAPLLAKATVATTT